jgi:hypothetical protein
VPYHEPAFIKQFAVKAFHVPILHRPPRLNMHQLDFEFYSTSSDIRNTEVGAALSGD